MKITISLIEKLIRLRDGEVLPASALNDDLVNTLVREGAVTRRSRGVRRTVSVLDADVLAQILERQHPGLGDLDVMHRLLQSKGADAPLRGVQAAQTGNSKLVAKRTFSGFLVNAIEGIECRLNGRRFAVEAVEGAMTFVYDWQRFEVPTDVVIVGMENAENFRYLAQQKPLFDVVLPQARLLFVCRYPQGQSHDLREWLMSIPNRYVHFGDLDLAGVNIYLTEYYRHIGERASFLLPPDYQERIRNGSNERYLAQYSKYGALSVTDGRLQPLVDCIHQHHRGYDQEGYITIPLL